MKELERAVVYRPSRPIAGVRPFFLLPRWEEVPYWERCGGAPEAPLIEWMAGLLPEHSSVIDCGAHVGDWAITLAMKGHDVLAFEPQPWLARLCAAGVALNGLDDLCEVCDFGLSDHAGFLELEALYEDGGGGSLVVKSGPASALRMHVEVRRLDSISLGALSLMKLDVEGAELDVLRGAIETIHKHRPKLAFECWDDERGQRKEALFAFLHDELRYKTSKTTWPEFWVADPR